MHDSRRVTELTLVYLAGHMANFVPFAIIFKFGLMMMFDFIYI